MKLRLLRCFMMNALKKVKGGSELQKRYQFGNNVLVNFRDKINIKYLEQFKDRNDPTINKIYTNEI